MVHTNATPLCSHRAFSLCRLAHQLARGWRYLAHFPVHTSPSSVHSTSRVQHACRNYLRQRKYDGLDFLVSALAFLLTAALRGVVGTDTTVAVWLAMLSIPAAFQCARFILARRWWGESLLPVSRGLLRTFAGHALPFVRVDSSSQCAQAWYLS